jgi:putative FmdB family regulatory protein
MPTYEYSCAECGNVVNIYRSFEESDPGYDCPNEECTGTLDRVWQAVGIHFKGGGFYKTDNR